MQETTLTAMLMTCPYVASFIPALTHTILQVHSSNGMSSYFGSEMLQQDDEFGPLKYGHVIKFPGGDEEQAEEMGERERERWSGERCSCDSAEVHFQIPSFFLRFSSFTPVIGTLTHTRQEDRRFWVACEYAVFLLLFSSTPNFHVLDWTGDTYYQLPGPPSSVCSRFFPPSPPPLTISSFVNVRTRTS